MWQGKAGPCTCYFCERGKPHPVNRAHQMTERRGRLQVAESLDPRDVIWTRMCRTCTHEEKIDE